MTLSVKKILHYLEDKQKKYVGRILQTLTKVQTHLDGHSNQFGVFFITEYFSEVGEAILAHRDGEHFKYVVLVNPAADVVSLRSRKGEIDISAIAKKLGGGGHKEAAGFHMKFKNSIEYKIDNKLNKLE